VVFIRINFFFKHFLKIITENKKIQCKILNNIKAKEKWHKIQIANFLNKRQNAEENHAKKTQEKTFAIRRDIKEIPGINEEKVIKDIKSQKKEIKEIKSQKNEINEIKSPKNLIKSPQNPIKHSDKRNLCYFSHENPLLLADFADKGDKRPISPNIGKSMAICSKGPFKNIVIRKEYPKKTSENALNRSISEIVRKNDKTLEELLKYSKNIEKPSQKAQFFQILSEDEAHATKMAKIMYLHKSKHRNYSNSNLIEHSHTKSSLKNLINSLKKPTNYITEYDEENVNNHIIRKFSIDFQPKTPNFFLLKKPNSNEENRRNLASITRGGFMKKKSDLLIEILNKNQIKSERMCEAPVSSSCHFFSPFTSNPYQKPIKIMKK